MKSTTLTVAAAAMVIFVQSAEAREHHHGHRHHHSLVASRGTSAEARSTPNGLFAFAAANLAVEHNSVSGARPGASGCLVRLGDAAPRGRRSGPVLQSGAQLGALGQVGTGGSRSGGGVAAPCREDRRSAKRRMGYRIRQRRSCASRPPSLDRGSDCDQVGLIALVVCIFESKGPPRPWAAHL